MSEIVKYKNASNIEADARRALQPGVFGRAHVLIGLGLLVIMAGIIIPVPEGFSKLFDIGWIVTICLSIGVLGLSVMAKNLSELSGFASFVVTICLVKLGFAVASVKSIIVYQSAGSFIEKIGSFLLLDNLSVYAIVIPVAVLGGVVMVFMATGGVIRKTAKYASDTLPFKYISAEADLNASVINESQAVDIKGKIKSEAVFFLSMSAAGRFLQFGAVVNLLIIAAALLGILRSHASSGMGGGIVGDGAVEVDVMLTLGLLVVTFLPGVVLAFSCSSVVNKKNLRPVFIDRIPDGNGGEIEDNEFELLNPDFIEISNGVTDGRRLDVIGEAELVEVNSVEDIFEDAGGGDGCGVILDLILSESLGGRVVSLLCSERVDLLGVTSAVNICVQLAEGGKKCLLIDADAKRGAVYKVFDINVGCDAVRPFDSCVDGLAVWSVEDGCHEIGNDLVEKISDVEGDYDCVVIYAPRIQDSDYYGKLAGLINVAGFAVGQGDDNGEKYIMQLKGLFASVDCRCVVRDTLV